MRPDNQTSNCEERLPKCEFCRYLGTKLFNVAQPAFHKTLQHRKKIFPAHVDTHFAQAHAASTCQIHRRCFLRAGDPVPRGGLFTKPWFQIEFRPGRHHPNIINQQHAADLHGKHASMLSHVHPSDLFSIVLALFVNYLVHIIQPDLVTALAETALGRRLDRKTRVERVLRNRLPGWELQTPSAFAKPPCAGSRRGAGVQTRRPRARPKLPP